MTTQSAMAPTSPTALMIAGETWAQLVPAMAARGRMRVSRDGGRNYRRRDERPVTGRLPNQPAALLVYDQDGCAPIFYIDLGTSKQAGIDPVEAAAAVDRDFRALTAILRRAGLTSWLSDRSPSGGRHLYVPLALPVPFAEARAVALSLAARVPSMDPLPMLGLSDGCIRPPGGRHRTGGHQVLEQDLEAATAALAEPNPASAWRRLVDDLTTDPASDPVTGRRSAETPSNGADSLAGEPLEDDQQSSELQEQLESLRGWREPDAAYQRIARTGEYDQARYASPSEARAAVVWSAAASGWRLVDLVRRVEDGTWRGLASMYARYPRAHRRAAVTRDWRAAIAFEKRRRESADNRSVRLRTTSSHKTHGGAPGLSGAAAAPAARGFRDRAAAGVQVHVRQWLTAVDLLHTGEQTLAERFVLRALAEAAVLTDPRSLSSGTGPWRSRPASTRPPSAASCGGSWTPPPTAASSTWCGPRAAYTPTPTSW